MKSASGNTWENRELEPNAHRSPGEARFSIGTVVTVTATHWLQATTSYPIDCGQPKQPLPPHDDQRLQPGMGDVLPARRPVLGQVDLTQRTELEPYRSQGGQAHEGAQKVTVVQERHSNVRRGGATRSSPDNVIGVSTQASYLAFVQCRAKKWRKDHTRTTGGCCWTPRWQGLGQRRPHQTGRQRPGPSPAYPQRDDLQRTPPLPLGNDGVARMAPE
jgi:hypothetical protein